MTPTPPFFIKHLRTEYTGDQATIYFARSATAPSGNVLAGIPEALPTRRGGAIRKSARPSARQSWSTRPKCQRCPQSWPPMA